MRVQVQALLGDPGDQLIEVVAREPLAAIACRLHLGFIAVVPDEVDSSRLGPEARGVLVLDAIAIRKVHHLSSARLGHVSPWRRGRSFSRARAALASPTVTPPISRRSARRALRAT